MFSFKYILWALVLFFGRLESGVAADDIFTTLQHAGGFDAFIRTAKAAGMEETLEHGGPYTVFAPTDEAFGKLPGGMIDNLLKPVNKDQLARILETHLVRGKLPLRDLKSGTLTTISGSKVEIIKEGSVPLFGGGAVSLDTVASNGIIHALTRLIIPAEQTVAKPILKPDRKEKAHR